MQRRGATPPIHRRFNEDEAIKQIRNRYSQIGYKIKGQVEILQGDEEFCYMCQTLYDKGYKDWMILAAIFNVVLNLEMRDAGVDYTDQQYAEQFMRDLAQKERHTVYSAELFLGDEFDRALITFQFTALLTWGFHPRARLLSPTVVEWFLRERMRHFDYDLPHHALFGDPPGDWPSLE